MQSSTVVFSFTPIGSEDSGLHVCIHNMLFSELFPSTFLVMSTFSFTCVAICAFSEPAHFAFPSLGQDSSSFPPRLPFLFSTVILSLKQLCVPQLCKQKHAEETYRGEVMRSGREHRCRGWDEGGPVQGLGRAGSLCLAGRSILGPSG